MKIWLCQVQLHMDFQHHDTIYKRLMIEFLEKCLDRKMDRRTARGKDGQTQFHMTLLATTGVPKVP